MTVLRGITWGHTRGYAPMVVTSQVYADRHGPIEIGWDRRSLWAFGEQPLESVVDSYDLLVVDHPMIGWAAEAGAFVPFPRSDVSPERAVGRSQQSYEYDGRHYALAIDAACQVSAARADLLAGLDVAHPVTWTDVFDLARRTGRVGFPFEAIGVYSSFLTICAHLGAEPAATAEQFVDPAAGARALALLAELATLVPEWCHELNPIGLLDRMASADDVVYCPLAYGYTNYSRDGYADRPVVFRDIPCVEGFPPRGSCLGGAGLAVSSASKEQAAAMAYARWVASPEVQRTEYVRAGGQPAARSAWDDVAANELTRDFFTGTRATIESAYLRPRHPGFPDFQTKAAGLLREAVLSNAFDSAAEQVNELYRQSHARS